jgi:hypothetical protein
MSDTPGQRTPGDDTPGAETPGFEMPGARTPGRVASVSVSGTDLAVDSTGTTSLGSLSGDRIAIEDVVVNATAADFSFQVTVGGTALFDGAVSPSGTSEESFTPSNTDGVFVGNEDEDVVFEVTSASTTGGATTDATVNATSEESA